MIGPFRSKALRSLWEKDDASGVNPNDIRDLDVPGFRFHALKGFRPTRYSMRVTGNWRITFEWDGKTANAIDLEDYHGR